MDCNGQHFRLNLPYECFLGFVKFADFTSHTRMTIDEKKYVFENMCEIEMKAYTVVAIVLWSGEVNLGHYTVAAKVGGVWNLYNDAEVYEIGDDAYFSYSMKNNLLGLPYTIVGETN